MKEILQTLTIIDLVSEKHIVLRRKVEEQWAKVHQEEISHTEAMLLAKIHMGKISLAEVARQANVTRQAMYKCAKQLEAKGYLIFKEDETHNKYTALTEKGMTYCEESQRLKQEIEEEIVSRIGEAAMRQLKELLAENWL